MESFRDRIELFFESLVHIIFKYRWAVLILSLLLTGILSFQVRHVEVNTSNEALFSENAPEILTYNRFRGQFGSAEVAVIAIRSPQIFSAGFLKKLQALHHELEKGVPYLGDIKSLVNVTAIRGEQNEVIIEGLMDNWPEDPEKIPEFIDFMKNYATANQLYLNYLISEDNTYTTIFVRPEAFIRDQPVAAEEDLDAFFEDKMQPDSIVEDRSGSIANRSLTDKENAAFVKALFDITQKYNSEGFSIFITGHPIISYSLQSEMQKDVPRFTLMAVLIVFLLLFILFRRVTGVLLPLIVVILSMLSSIALFGLFNKPFTVITQVVPSFIISVSVCDSVHLLAVFYRRLLTDHNKETAMAYAMRHSGLAILMTSMTTATGLLSFSGAKIAPVADLGIFTATGVMMACLYTIILLPALAAVIPIEQKKKKKGDFESVFDSILVSLGNFASKKPWYVISVSFLIVFISAIGISRLRFSHNLLSWFPENNPIPVNTSTIDKNMKGSMSMEVLVETNRENALYEPDLMNRLETFNRKVEEITEGELFIGKSVSVADTLKQINQSLNENQTAYYGIPQNRQLIAQEFLIFENGGTDDLERLVDSRFSKARITLKLPWVDANAYAGIQKKITGLLSKTFDDVEHKTVTGMISLLTRTIYNMIVTMMTSYIVAGVVITIMMIFLVGSIKYGLLSMIPNIFPIIIALGLMGHTGMTLDLSNILIGSIVIGLAVDDTVHFFHNFRRYYTISGNVHFAVNETLLSTGRALLFTTLALASGFAVFTISDMKNLTNFGVISGLAVVMALLADLLLVPALMTIFEPTGKETKQNQPNGL